MIILCVPLLFKYESQKEFKARQKSNYSKSLLYWYFILTVEDSPFHLQIHPVVPLDVLLLEPLLVDDLERLGGFTYDVSTGGEKSQNHKQ